MSRPQLSQTYKDISWCDSQKIHTQAHSLLFSATFLPTLSVRQQLIFLLNPWLPYLCWAWPWCNPTADSTIVIEFKSDGKPTWLKYNDHNLIAPDNHASGKLLTCGWSDVSDVSDSCGVRILSFPFFHHKFQGVKIFSVFYLCHTLPELRLCQKFAIKWATICSSPLKLQHHVMMLNFEFPNAEIQSSSFLLTTSSNS